MLDFLQILWTFWHAVCSSLPRGTRGVQKGSWADHEVAQRYKGHSVYENTTSQYIQKKKYLFALLVALLEEAYLKTLKNGTYL